MVYSELRGAGLDESPHCYKRLPDLMEDHSASIVVLHTLTPVAQPGPPVSNTPVPINLEERRLLT